MGKTKVRTLRGLLPLVVGALAASGCARTVWFTQPLREAYELGVVPGVEHNELPNDAEGREAVTPTRTPDELQYFVSERLVLQREVMSRNDSLAHGRIRVRQGKFVDQVVIRSKTPGVAVDWGDDWIAISFEEGSSLVFSTADDASGRGDVYHLRETADPSGGRAGVELAGRRYRVRSGHSARLEIRRNKKTKRSRQRTVLRGRRIEGGSP
ncbi:MAG: hypothetical protein K0V04_32785 [Deltaproteobacteria bacterium]|nr:hypothetical protein [Deltaproteobacteria bacterium]